MSTTHIDRVKALAVELRDIVANAGEGRLPGPVARRRDAIIARLRIEDEIDLAVEASGLTRVRVLNIARVTEPADVPTDGSTIATAEGVVIAEQRHIDATPKATKPKAAPKPKADPAPKRRGFDPAPPGGHVPPRQRKIRSTGSLVTFGHASEMGFPKTPVDAHDWVSRCDTHSTKDVPVLAHYETRGESRYVDGTEYCLDCAAAASA